LDSGIVAEYATHASALFTMLRGYVEMCPHASLHLINLKTTKRLLNYLMEPQVRDGSYASTCTPAGAFLACAPTWNDHLRVWTPAQQREMGNLYYLLALLVLQTSLDEYCTIRPTGSSPAHPVLLSVPNTTSIASSKQGSWGRLMLRPHKETVTWLGIVPSGNFAATNASFTGKTSSPSGTKSLGPTPQSHPFRQVSSELRSDSGPTDDTYLVGLFNLCEVLLRAYLENAATPNLASLSGIIDVGRNLSSVSVAAAASTATNTSSGSAGNRVAVASTNTAGGQKESVLGIGSRSFQIGLDGLRYW
uniref:Phosphorylase b kinase regulatory subunit n=1 Tax=Echinostoma caproni TaxID=27848 RepID=A0A183B6B3_9TREM